MNRDYQPTDIDDEAFLSEVPLHMLEESILNQFKHPMERVLTDNVNTFITRYKYTRDMCENEEDYESLEYLRDDFVRFMLKAFDVYFGIGFPDNESIGVYDMHEMLHLTYRFLIKNMSLNMVNFITSYINDHKEEITTWEEAIPKRKDALTLNFKSEIDNSDDLIIISNLSKIIDHILHLDIDCVDFIHMCQGDSVSLEYSFFEEKYRNFEITGNFVPRYLGVILDNKNFIVELECSVRSNILLNYKDRIPKEKPKKK